MNSVSITYNLETRGITMKSKKPQAFCSETTKNNIKSHPSVHLLLKCFSSDWCYSPPVRLHRGLVSEKKIKQLEIEIIAILRQGNNIGKGFIKPELNSVSIMYIFEARGITMKSKKI